MTLSIKVLTLSLSFSAYALHVPLSESQQDPEWIIKLQESFGEKKCDSCLSQHSQDEYARQIFKAIGETDRFYVEFGFNSPTFEGGSGANSLALAKRGWKGLLLTGEYENKTINLHQHFLFQNNIAEIFKKYEVPENMDYLSVDMDSHDLFVLRSILASDYKPRVINAEFNANYWGSDAALSLVDPTLATGSVPSDFVFKLAGCAWGASAAALNAVAKEFNYTLIGRVSHLDVIFIRNDLIKPEWKMPEWKFLFPEEKDKSFIYKNGETFKQHAMHKPQKSQEIFEKMIDYKTWQRTKDVKASTAAAKDIICREFSDSHCWRAVANQKTCAGTK